MVEIQHHVLKLRYLQSHHDVRLTSIFICEYCGKVYRLRFQDGASREHCAEEACRNSHGLEAALRNRLNSRIRMRILRAMGDI